MNNYISKGQPDDGSEAGMPRRPAWRLAKCKTAVESGADPDDWFPKDWQARDRAKAVCNGCPVKKQCLEYGKAEDLVGYWGGKLLGYQLTVAKPTVKPNAVSPMTGRTHCRLGHRLVQKKDQRRCATCKRVNDRNSWRRNHGKKQSTRTALFQSSDKDRQLLAAEIERLTADGKSAREISDTLQVSSRLVQRYRNREEVA